MKRLGGGENHLSQVLVNSECLEELEVKEKGEPFIQAPRESERALVRCGAAVWCGALWDMLRCSGVAMVTCSNNQSWWWELTECKLVYATSALIFTAWAARQHLTCSFRATPIL